MTCLCVNGHWLVLAAAATAAVALAATAMQAGQASAPAPALSVAPGPFEPTFDSLAQYKCPEWFRDAKLGIWAHWGPQAVPMAGDWYAKNMYVQGHRQYQDHLEKYGHPSEHGYKDIIPLWKAEKWDPGRLMALYKKAGAKYFVSMGSHHDNFFLWNSRLHKWNAVNMGPKRDVVGDWQKAARKEGLRFGVSEHLGASFTWFQTSHGSDKTGPKAGVPYDGADQKYWDLYHFPAEPGDKGWYSNNPKWQHQWFEEIKELVDNYQPDLLYTDGGVPFANEVGRSMIAHLYNADAARHGGKAENVDVVYTCKQESKGMWIQDLERGVMAGIRPDPWQTDTSIGDWYYNKNWKYRGADWVIQMLVDIVAKNGNLLINVVQRPDGSLDAEAEQVLAEMAAWIAINGEAIYETRPWLVHGEGPVRAKGGHFKEDFAYSVKDIRFTCKGDKTLYAFAMGWPTDGKIVIRTLARLPEVTAKIADISLLGSSAKITWKHDADGLTVHLPSEPPCKYAIALKITGEDLRGFKPELAVPPSQSIPVILPDGAGNVSLEPDDAELHGDLKTENQGGKPNIGFWDKGADWASWKVNFKEAGSFKVTAACAASAGDSALAVEIGGQEVEGKVAATGAWDKFATVEMGVIEVKKAGEQVVKVRPADPAKWKAVNLRGVRLTNNK
jgi:alpha-L-fucosidase